MHAGRIRVEASWRDARVQLLRPRALTHHCNCRSCEHWLLAARVPKVVSELSPEAHLHERALVTRR